MENKIEFSEFYKLLNAIKEGDETKKENLCSVLSDFQEGRKSENFLNELGQKFISIGIDELFKYTNSTDLKFIGQLSKEEWEELADKNKGELPTYLANKMIAYVKENQFLEALCLKWSSSQREIEKHVMPMAAYITEGFIDVLE